MKKDFNDFTLKDLYNAYYDCRKHKRNTIDSLKFERDLEINMLELYNDLKKGTYKIGKSICFITLYPKPREVFAADFRDRVVHHLLIMKIEPIIAPSFVYDSSASQKNKGVLFAQNRLYKHMQSVSDNFHKEAYYLQMDIRSFFMSIKKDILWNMLDKKIIDGFYKDLLKKIIYNNPTNNFCFKGDKNNFIKLKYKSKSLFFTPEGQGLPIGNLTSQFFANAYLNQLDNYIKRELRCKYYSRYVDDFVLLSEDKEELKIWREKIKEFVKKHLKLDIHPNKIIMQKISQGINYVGAILKPYHRYARSRIYGSFEKALCSLEKNKGESIDKKHTLSQLNSYMGFIKHSSYRKRFFKLYKKYIKTININFSLNLQRMCFVLRE